MNIQCSFCHALHWKAEALTSSTINNPKFGMCCYQGKISLPKLHAIPPDLFDLYIGNNPDSSAFHQLILYYNNSLAMTSVGKTTDHTVNQDGRGPYSYVLRGELIHQAGTILPLPNEDIVYSQLYIHDTDHALDHRLNRHNARNRLSPLNRQTLNLLQGILHQSHPAVQFYQQALELTTTMTPDQQCRISLHFDQNCDRHRYNLPDATTREIAVIVIGDGEQFTGPQDIIVYRRNHAQRIFRISDSHPLYPSLRYVLLFPTGQMGWYPRIPLNGVENEVDQAAPRKRKYVSLEEYFHYCFHIRPAHFESNHLFLAGKLFQAYVCESWAVAEQQHLAQLAAIQDNLRVELYQGLADAVVANVDVNLNNLGKRTILPSSFTGGTRYMQQLCQDALAINRYFGGGDLFITMTANSGWPEIKDALFYNQTAAQRPDLITRVFHAKLHSLIKDIKNGILGDILGFLYTIEFQKRGLPHAHIIVFLKPHAKLRTPEQVDSLMSSEFPEDNPELLELIKKFMIHGPCGDQNKKSPCMENGKCTKGFPKPFNKRTTITEDSYAKTRHLNTGQIIRTGPRDKYRVDNTWVVCHSKYLIWKYRCHINVESIASVKAVKYIYKYVYKGHDRTTMQFGAAHDEIKHYLDARYVSSCEATWRLYFFEVQDHEPSVLRLAVHLPQQQGVVINPDRDTPQQVLERHENRDTTLTGWFKANAQHRDNVINNTLYQDFPNKMVWNKNRHVWTVRQRSFQIGRMYYAHPSAGEHFYLRLLLTVVKGAISYEDLRTFQGVLYPTFREACIAHGITEDDNEWRQCLEEAKHMAVGRQMRHLFVTILKDCNPADPRALWDTFWQDICDDLKCHSVFRDRGIKPPEEDIHDYGLYLINQLLLQAGKSLQDWDCMPQVVQNWGTLLQNLNPLIAEQRDYNPQEQANLAEQQIANLNPDQHSAFNKITSAITNRTGEIFFLQGPGGTGKTYLYNTLCYHLHSQGKIVLCVASSGIAALLLKGGRTAHSRFKIPIPINQDSICSINKNTHLSDLICQTDLVIWDEAPMQHWHIIQAVHKTFKDLRGSNQPFGGVTVVFGGDFQQILPVILKGSRAAVVGACIKRSFLWNHIKLLHLHQNMRLNTNVEAEANFAKWQLEVGQGKHTDDSCNISLPNHFCCAENTVDSLIDTIYPNIHMPGHSDQYFSERIILSSMNNKVNELNETVLARFPGHAQLFPSVDFIPNSERLGE